MLPLEVQKLVFAVFKSLTSVQLDPFHVSVTPTFSQVAPPAVIAADDVPTPAKY